MKRIIFTGFLITTMYIANAQTTNNTTEAEKSVLSKQVGDPLVNGKPYSQYKAEQNALKLKQQQEADAAKQNNPAAKLSMKSDGKNTGTVVVEKAVDPAAMTSTDKPKEEPATKPSADKPKTD